MAPSPEADTEEEAAQRQGVFERQRAEYKEEQQRREEERKPQFEKKQAEYEAERNHKAEILKARQTTFERILENAPPMFSAAQLRVFLRAVVNLDPYDFAEDEAQQGQVRTRAEDNNQESGGRQEKDRSIERAGAVAGSGSCFQNCGAGELPPGAKLTI